ncbi:hypothetical protein RE628_05660 [Paenibacillus sp. D2_2]|uniref:hypothetical protein n=1 Tax=Paenibacillus sp. D2_2 TaxID=3073092 RepID=UPI0028163C7F|nr:hypothetical protein [Paenibacillus sp. D2_2]WMT41929.1 hypothetical protein RE628_05660 [Paenibacillus sp. D2_2]
MMKKYIPFTYKMLVPYLLLVLITDIVIGYISYTMLIQSGFFIAGKFSLMSKYDDREVE